MQTVVVPVESFLDPIITAEIWPENVAANPIFLRQLSERKRLDERLHAVTDSLLRPDISTQVAIEQGYITEEQTAKLYESLSDLLDDPDYKRLILYLPFEFLPDKTWYPSGEKLRQSSARFTQAYMKCWRRLLYVHDVRANFVDGNVLETELRIGDLPRVVKAAHLIPKLIEKGLMTAEDAVTLMGEGDDQVLKDSIADALPELKITKQSVESLFPNAQYYGAVTEKRRRWLEEEKRRKAIEALAEIISAAIIKNGSLGDIGISDKSSLVEGIRMAVESAASTDCDKAQVIYERYKPTLLALFGNNDADVDEAILKAMRRFNRLGIVYDNQLKELNIAIPKLAGPFSENLKLIDKEMDIIRAVVAYIESNPELSQFLYPILLLAGSRLKGYGNRNSDIDFYVLVRPGTPFDARVTIKELLRKIFAGKNIRENEVVEFWLEEKNGLLKVRDFEKPDVSLGESGWTHILFGAAWIGELNSIREMFAKLLTRYLYAGGNKRRLYLEELERDTLQYRLMHKGYERFFPQYGGINAQNADKIDGKSMFWDSGYRQLATRLFISRVFLPKIPAPKN